MAKTCVHRVLARRRLCRCKPNTYHQHPETLSQLEANPYLENTSVRIECIEKTVLLTPACSSAGAGTVLVLEGTGIGVPGGGVGSSGVIGVPGGIDGGKIVIGPSEVRDSVLHWMSLAWFGAKRGGTARTPAARKRGRSKSWRHIVFLTDIVNRIT